MKKFIALCLAGVMLLGTTAVFAESFSDISGHWAEEEIISAQGNGIVNGDGTGAFRPDDKVTRAEFVKMASAMLVPKYGVKEVPEGYKTEDIWYSKYYNFATQMYLITDNQNTIDGIHPGVFEDNAQEPIRRWEMAYIAGSMLKVTIDETYTSEPTFTDIETVNSLPGADFMKIAAENGIIKVDGNGAFNPMGTGTRAEAVVIISRLNDFIDNFILEETVRQQEEAYNKALEEINSKLIIYEEKDIPKSNVKVRFYMENGKSFTAELYPEYAPQTVANFVKLVQSGFYDGLTFHRVVDGFMAQGGDPNGDGSGGSGNYIFGEFAENRYTQNTLTHEEGTISMARSQLPNSASSQFFICYGDASFLDGQYAAFGKVISGMETVKEFLNEERSINEMGEKASPVKPIVIKKARVVQ